MRSLRRANTLITLLLLTTALVVTIANYTTPPLPPPLPKVQGAVLTVTLSSSTGRQGNVITFTATGATSPDGTFCSAISGAPANVVTNSQGQVFGGTAYGSFVVGTGPSGVGGAPYTLTITCGPDSGTKPFTVTPAFAITPIAALPGKTVTVTVNGLPSDTVGPCTITSNVMVQEVVSSSPQPCTIPPGSGSATGTFIANGGASYGTYTITVHFSGGSISSPATPPPFPFSTTGFVMTPTPTSIIWTPNHGPPGWGSVSITGGGFVSTGSTRSCAVIITAGTLTDPEIVSRTCTIDPSGTLSAGFAVSLTATSGHAGTMKIDDPTTPGGPFLITPGTFSVDGPPGLPTLSASSGVAGTWIRLSGPLSFFGPFDAGVCTISSSPSPLFSSSFCAIDNSGKILLATFQVSATAPRLVGGYTLTVTGSHGDPSSPSLTFNVDPVATPVSPIPFQGSPPVDALPGTTVVISGTGYLSTDTGCTMNFGPPLVTGLTCSVPVPGQITARFVVGAGTLFVTGGYGLVLRGTPNLDSASVSPNFLVVPRIVLSPSSGPAGTGVLVSGSGYKGFTGACTTPLSSTPSGLFTSSTCALFPDGTATATFTVDAGALDGAYTVTLTDNGASPPTASAVFTKGAGALSGVVNPHISLSPTSGVGGTVVAVSGYGFAAGSGDTSCTISPAPAGLFTTSGCGIAGTFTTTSVSTTTSTTTTISTTTITTVTRSTTSSTTTSVSSTTKVTSFTSNTAFPVTTTTTTGTSNKLTIITTAVPTITVVTTTTSFSTSRSTTASTSTTTSSTTSFSTITSTTQSTTSTTFTQANIAGSFQVDPAAPDGVYVITVTGLPNGDHAAAVFTKGSPSATVTVSPQYGRPGDVISVSGSGFSLADNGGCTISTTIPLVIATSTCNITGGILAGSFTISPSATTGLTGVVVTGLSKDFATGLLDIVVLTTASTTTTTSTTFSSSTTLSTTTTSTGISTSFSTTTFTSTGPTTQVFTHGELTTVTGQSTATSLTTVIEPTTFTTSTTTTTTALSTHTIGQVIRPVGNSWESYYPDIFGLLALLSLGPMLFFRRPVA